MGAGARMLPFFVLGMLSGAIADRWERRTLLRIGTVGASAAALTMALLLLFDLANEWVIIGLVLALGSAMAFTITVRQTFTYDIVGSGHALNGLALGAMAMQGGGIVGSLVSGAVIEFVGPGLAVPGVGGGLPAVGRRDPGNRQSGKVAAHVSGVGAAEPGRIRPPDAGTPADPGADAADGDYRGAGVHPT